MQSNQRGGIVSFIIVAVALAGLLGGGLYLSKQQARQARDEPGTNVPQVTTEQKQTETGTPEAGKPDNESGTAEEQQSPTPAPSPSPNPTEQPSSPQPQPQSQPQTDRVATTGPSESLPATGPADTAVYMLALAVLAFAGYRHLQSRRLVRQAALRQ